MKKSSIWIEKHGESFIYVVFTVVTIVCAALSNVFADGTVPGIIVNVGFYAGLSIDMLLIMWGFPKIKDTVEALHKYVKQEECIHFDAYSKKQEEDKFNAVIKEESGGSVYIFCYGTNLYGDFIPYVIEQNKENKKKFKINLVVCNPDSSLIADRSEEIRILIKKIGVCVDNIKHFDSLYLLSTPKTFRACMVKDVKGRSLRASFQSYIISEDRFMSTKQSRTPIISACKNNGDVLVCIEEILDKEWEDVKSSDEVFKIIDGGKLTEEGEAYIQSKRGGRINGTVHS